MPYSPDHKAKSKGQIVQSATELFLRYGFDKVSINQVMKLAKMTHGAFYNHFESKEALYRETFQEVLKRSKAVRLIKWPYSLQHLTSLVTDYLNIRDLGKSNVPVSEAILSNEIANENVEIRKLYEQAYLNLLNLLEKRLKALSRLKNSGFKIDPSIIPERARVILASMIGAVVIAKSINDKEEKQAVLSAAQTQIFHLLEIDDEYLSMSI